MKILKLFFTLRFFLLLITLLTASALLHTAINMLPHTWKDHFLVWAAYGFLMGCFCVVFERLWDQK